MNDRPDMDRDFTRSNLNDCWNSIGVHGNASCPELEKHVHCRNCPVYSAGALALLDGYPPANYLADWTSHFAEPKQAELLDTRATVYLAQGRAEQAVADLEAATRDAPSGDRFFRLARAYKQANNLRAANTAWRKAKAMRTGSSAMAMPTGRTSRSVRRSVVSRVVTRRCACCCRIRCSA